MTENTARASAQRALELIEAEVTTARRHLAALRRKQRRLRATAVGSPPAVTGTANTVAVAGVPVTVEVISGELVIIVGCYGPAAVGRLDVDPRFGTATVVTEIADENGDTCQPGRRSYFDLYPAPNVISPDAGGS